MSDYQQFLQERDQMDFLLQKDYKIKKVTENLNGALVDFEKGKNTETLYIGNSRGKKILFCEGSFNRKSRSISD